eukprot:Rmarinus@m.1308
MLRSLLRSFSTVNKWAQPPIVYKPPLNLTEHAKEHGSIRREWYLLDVKDQDVRRMAVQIACILQGKHKPIYDPRFPVGDSVVVINSRHVVLPNNKKDQDRVYFWHTGYPGGKRYRTAKQFRMTQPNKILLKELRLVLPNVRLRPFWLSERLHVFPDEEHTFKHHNLKVLKPHSKPRFTVKRVPAEIGKDVIDEYVGSEYNADPGHKLGEFDFLEESQPQYTWGDIPVERLQSWWDSRRPESSSRK